MSIKDVFNSLNEAKSRLKHSFWKGLYNKVNRAISRGLGGQLKSIGYGAGDSFSFPHVSVETSDKEYYALDGLYEFTKFDVFLEELFDLLADESGVTVVSTKPYVIKYKGEVVSFIDTETFYKEGYYDILMRD